MPLPTDIDASYPDDLSDPSVSLHQQYHDQIHVAVNAIEAAYDAAVTAGFAGTMEEWLEQLNAAATTYQTVAEKGVADGYASLDSGGKVPAAQLPDLSLTDVNVVADITGRDALTVQEGDVAVVTDAGSGQPRSYIYDGSAWQELQTPGDSVMSVDGRTGTVTLTDLYDAAGSATAAQTAAQTHAEGLVDDLSGVTDAATARTNLGLSTVAATGSYNDLADTPTFSTALRLTAPDNTVYEVTVDNAGTLTTTVVP